MKAVRSAKQASRGPSRHLRRGWGTFPLMALGWVVAVACAEGGVVGGDCAPGLTQCGLSCVDLLTDGAHCGACGVSCDPGLDCQAGACGGADPSRDGGIGDGGYRDVDWPDGVAPDGSVADAGPDALGEFDGGLLPDGGPVCVPPYRTASFCGDCDTQCTARAPLCEPVADGYECVPRCSDGLTDCSATCADLEADPEHCGRCGHACPSRLCVSGECVGLRAGDVVAMCMNDREAPLISMQTTLLGNAVFLSPVSNARIGVYGEATDEEVRTSVLAALSAAASGRSYELVELSDSEAVTEALAGASVDVLLVLDQSEAAPGELLELGREWRLPIGDFTRNGGVVVALAGPGGQMHEWLSESGVLETGELQEVTLARLVNQAPSNAVGRAVLDQFLALPDTCSFDPLASSDVDAIAVVTTHPLLGDPRPVVVHRVVSPEG